MAQQGEGEVGVGVAVAQRGPGEEALGVLEGGNNMADQEHYIICNLDVVIDEFRSVRFFACAL